MLRASVIMAIAFVIASKKKSAFNAVSNSFPHFHSSLNNHYELKLCNCLRIIYFIFIKEMIYLLSKFCYIV